MAFSRNLGNVPIVDTKYIPNYNADTTITANFYQPSGFPSDRLQQPAWVRANCLNAQYSGGSNNVVVPFVRYNPLFPATETNVIMGGVSETIGPFGEDEVVTAWKPNLAVQLVQTNFANFDKDFTQFYLGFVEIRRTLGGDPVAYCLMSWRVEHDHADYEPASRFANTLNIEVFQDRFNLTVKAREFDPDYGEPSTPDGYGQKNGEPAFDHSSDIIGIPDRPTVSVTTAGFYHAYKVTAGLLQDFGAKLFPSIGQIVGSITGVSTVEDVLKQAMTLLLSPTLYQGTQIAGQTISVIDMIMNGKAIDYVVDCHIIPVMPTVGGSANIKCGAQTIDISAPVITGDYIDFDCGSISIPENFQNYVDFHGTRAKLFLTGVGFVDIKPEFWNGGTLGVKYRFNILDGSFMCYVTSTSGKSQLANTVIGQYGGCMCLHIPVTGINYASMVAGLVTGSMSLAGNIATGNVAGATSSALSVANTKPSLAQSNNYNSSTAFLGVRRPYLQIERQVPSFSKRYNSENGLPLNVAMPLGSVSGFTIIEDPRLDLTCDDEEREEIYMLLQKGVIF